MVWRHVVDALRRRQNERTQNNRTNVSTEGQNPVNRGKVDSRPSDITAGRLDSVSRSSEAASIRPTYDNLHQEAFGRFQRSHPQESESLLAIRRLTEGTGEVVPASWPESVTCWLLEQRSELKKNGSTPSKGQMRLNVADLLAKFAKWTKAMVVVGDVVVQFDPVHAALPWAAFRFILQSALNHLETEEKVWAGVERLCKDLVWAHLWEGILLDGSIQIGEELRETFVVLYVVFFKLLATFVDYQKAPRTKRIASNIFASHGQLHDDLSALASTKTRIEDLTKHDSHRRLLEIRKTVADLEKPLHRIENVMSNMFQIIGMNQNRKILDWLSEVEYANHFASAKAKALPGTGLWINEEGQYKDWVGSSESQILRIHGLPGSGKSTLMSVLIESFKRENQETQGPLPVFYFCLRDPNEPRRSESAEVLRCLLRQLAVVQKGASTSIHHAVLARFHVRDDMGEISEAEAYDLCLQCINDRGPVFILIDAVDECEPKERPSLLRSLVRFASEASAVVKILVTSRDGRHQPIVIDTPHLKITAQRNKDDISLYVSHRVEELRNDRLQFNGRPISDDSCDHIQSQLCDKAQGMFRWVALQIQTIRLHCEINPHFDEESLHTHLRNVPEELFDSYSRIFELEMTRLSHLSNSYKDLALKVFNLLLVGHKRLSSDEFCLLVGYVDDQGNPRNKRELLVYCFSLVEYDETMDAFGFCHLSVREFFESPSFVEEHEDFAMTNLHGEAAARCLELVLDGIRKKIRPSPYPLYFWAHHASLADSWRTVAPLKHQIETILDDSSSCFKTWADFANNVKEDRWVWRHLPRDRAVHPVPIMIACRWGFHELVETLTQRVSGTPLDEIVICGYRHGLMSRAVRFNHFETVQALFGVGLNADGILSELSSSGVERDWTRLPQRVPLVSALWNDNLDMARLLVAHGADPNRCINTQSPLTAAVRAGDVAMIEELLVRGATSSVNLTFERGAAGFALRVAAERDNIGVVRLLLESGADVNLISNDRFKTALATAIDTGSSELVEFLVDSGADVNLPSGKERSTPLEIALKKGRLDIVRLLLSRGAFPGTGAPDRSSPLRTAAQQKSLEIVKLLLSSGADANELWPKKKTPLLSAIGRGHKELVTVLLDHNADIELESGAGRNTPLAVAIMSDSPEIVQLLLDHGANINRMSGKNPVSPMAIAARKGNSKMVDVLLANQAEINPTSTSGRTPLLEAVLGDHVGVVEKLLSLEANVDAVSGDERITPLSAAATLPGLGIARLLLQHGANLDVESSLYHSLLEKSAKLSDHSVAELLLQRKAEVDLHRHRRIEKNGKYDPSLA